MTDGAASPAAVRADGERSATLDLSIVVPVHDEEANVEPLCAEIVSACGKLGLSFEAILIDDGSTDLTFARAASVPASGAARRGK